MNEHEKWREKWRRRFAAKFARERRKEQEKFAREWARNHRVYVYLLLKAKRVVYVGISMCPELRLQAHWDKGWQIDDIVETPDGPYRRDEARRREKLLISDYRPRYNVVHKPQAGNGYQAT